ncbi:serine hydrolase [Lacticaseibacillus porcinae]|uniref:serine hydrolase n=1 Tax=Lacticaseibacillus porcinae TaxID=1123687 RepID=UPI000F773072|nr:serine hydrolase [Lacticaseibacillus porcinae]
MSKLWRSVVVFAAAIALWAGFSPAVTTQAATSSVDIDASAALAIEAKTGKVLYAKNTNQTLPIASMTKMLGIYLVREAIQSGQLKWTDTVTPTASIAKLSQNSDLSNVPLQTDGKYTIKQLYEASLIYSANAAMMLLGNAVSGNQTKFVDAMRTQLKTWGIKDATIINATGLDNNEIDAADRYPNSTDTDQNQMSAKDVAVIAQHLLNDYPDVLDTTKAKEMTFSEGSDTTKMGNYNLMLPGLSAAVAGLNVDGLKTGTTDRAGDCFTGTVEKNGMRIITVVMHANGSGDDKRFVQTGKLMNWVFGNWKAMQVTTKGAAVTGHERLTVVHGTKASVPLAATKTLTVYVPSSTTADDLDFKYIAHLQNKLEAPVQKSATAGTLTVSAKGDDLGYLTGQASESVTLTTTKGVKRANLFALIIHGVSEWFNSLF